MKCFKEKIYIIRLVFIFWIPCLLGFSCNETRKETLGENPASMAPPRYHVKIDVEKDSMVQSSSVFQRSWFLELESKEGALIGNIDKLLFDDDLIFVVDKERAQVVFIYDNEGRLIKAIDEKGKGPREFIEIRDVALDMHQKRICLLDLASRKINFYDYTGEYLESTPIPFLFSSFAYIDSSTIAFDLQTAYNRNEQIGNHYLVTAEMDGTIHNRAFNYENDEKGFTYWSARHLLSSGENVLFQPRFSNTIYDVREGEVLPFFFLDFLGKGFPDNVKIVTDDQFRGLFQKYSFLNGEYVDLKESACFAIDTPKGNLYVLYSKNTDKTISLRPFLIQDLLSGFFRPPFERYNDSTIVTFAPAYEALRSKKLYFSNSEEEGLGDDMFPDLSENDNPVLFFYNINKF